MSEFKIGISYISRDQIPISEQRKCPPPSRVLRLTASADLDLVKKIERRAIALTDKYPDVRNDFDDPDLSTTTVFRVVHALEHIVVLTWLMSGFIDGNALKSGSLAGTLPGNGREGEDIAAVWVRENLARFDLFANSILDQVQKYGGSWYYE